MSVARSEPPTKVQAQDGTMALTADMRKPTLDMAEVAPGVDAHFAISAMSSISRTSTEPDEGPAAPPVALTDAAPAVATAPSPPVSSAPPSPLVTAAPSAAATTTRSTREPATHPPELSADRGLPPLPPLPLLGDAVPRLASLPPLVAVFEPRVPPLASPPPSSTRAAADRAVR